MLFSLSLLSPSPRRHSARALHIILHICCLPLCTACFSSFVLFACPLLSVFSLIYISVVSFVLYSVSSYQSSLSCVCVCGAEIALFLFRPSPLIRSAQQYLSPPPSISRLFRSLGTVSLHIICCRRECRYFLLHQRSFRVPT